METSNPTGANGGMDGGGVDGGIDGGDVGGGGKSGGGMLGGAHTAYCWHTVVQNPGGLEHSGRVALGIEQTRLSM